MSLFAVLILFMSLALLLSMILSNRGTAGLVAGFFLVASYFITSLTRIDDDLELINQFSPLKYYQGSEAMSNLDLQYLLILFGVSIVLIALAWFVFVKRDLRFGGAGGLRLVFSHKEEISD
jgi:ABC-type transport system involved in multi-copper enzyme maturation permease subunit